MVNRSLLTGVLVTLMGSIAWAQTQIDQTRPISPNGSIEIKNVSGAVEVFASKANEIHVTGTLQKNVTRLDFDVQGQTAIIKVVRPRSVHHDGAAFLKIYAPVGCSLAVNTVSAPVTIHGQPQSESSTQPVPGASESDRLPATISVKTISAKIIVQSGAKSVALTGVSGDIKFTGQADTLKCDTVSGDLALTGNIASLAAKTISGDLVATGVGPNAVASSVSGGLRLAQTSIGNTALTTVSGDTTVEGPLANGGRINVNTISGDIRLSFTADPQARFDIHAAASRITSSLPGAEGVSRILGQRAFTTGDGAGAVRIQTTSGDVTLERRF